MSKIDRIFKKHGVDINVSYPPSPEVIKTMMKEYAKQYAKKCLKEYDKFLYEYNLDTQGVLSEFELPPHE